MDVDNIIRGKGSEKMWKGNSKVIEIEYTEKELEEARKNVGRKIPLERVLEALGAKKRGDEYVKILVRILGYFPTKIKFSFYYFFVLLFSFFLLLSLFFLDI